MLDKQNMLKALYFVLIKPCNNLEKTSENLLLDIFYIFWIFSFFKVGFKDVEANEITFQ